LVDEPLRAQYESDELIRVICVNASNDDEALSERLCELDLGERRPARDSPGSSDAGRTDHSDTYLAASSKDDDLVAAMEWASGAALATLRAGSER
jgi:hypothetical protein